MKKVLESKWTALIIFTVVSVIFASPVLRNINYLGGGTIDSYVYSDWDALEFLNAVPRETILKYHQIPLWNPYYCGGAVMLANPQSSFLSPTYILVLLFDTIIGLKIQIFIHLIIGMLGMFLLCRYLGIDVICSYLPAFVYMLGSMYPVMITSGMTIFWSIAYIPFVFLYYLKSLRKVEHAHGSKVVQIFERLKYILLTAFFLVLMVFEGGVIPFIYVVLFLLIYSLLQLLRSLFHLAYDFFKSSRHQRIFGTRVNIKNIDYKGLQSVILIMIFTFLIGAIKFVPMVSLILDHPRLISDYSGFSLETFYYSLLSREQHYITERPFKISWGGKPMLGCDFFNGMAYGWEENGMYVGWIPFALFLIGSVVCFKKHWELILTSFIFLWLSFGNRTTISLWNVIHAFPIFSSLRVAQRFRIILAFCLAILSGLSLHEIKKTLARRTNGKHRSLINIITFIIVAFVLIDLVIVDGPIFEQAFQIPSPQNFESTFYSMFGVKPDGSFFQVTGRYGLLYKFMYPIFLLNVGSIDAYESAMEVERNAIPRGSPEYKGEVFLLNTTGTVSVTYFSPNRIEVRANVSKEGYIIVNQNYSPDWKVEGSRHNRAEAINGLISTSISLGEHHVAFYYLPNSYVIGCFLTIATLFLILLGLVYYLSYLRTPFLQHTSSTAKLFIQKKHSSRAYAKCLYMGCFEDKRSLFESTFYYWFPKGTLPF